MLGFGQPGHAVKSQQSSHSDNVQMVGDVFSALTAAVGAADKVVELIQQKPGIPSQGSLQPGDFAGRVELEGVAFSYPARPEVPVLNGLTLKVNPGEVGLPLNMQAFCQVSSSHLVAISLQGATEHLPGPALPCPALPCPALPSLGNLCCLTYAMQACSNASLGCGALPMLRG